MSVAAALLLAQLLSPKGQMRRISAELRPGVLDKLGLVAALDWQAREIEARRELVVQVEADHVPEGLLEIVAVTFFRIAREALTNVLRHASARMVEVRLSAAADEIVLEIRDDGTCIAPESTARSYGGRVHAATEVG